MKVEEIGGGGGGEKEGCGSSEELRWSGGGDGEKGQGERLSVKNSNNPPRFARILESEVFIFRGFFPRLRRGEPEPTAMLSGELEEGPAVPR